MMGTGIPALDRAVPSARSAGPRGTAAQRGGGGFDDAVKSAARQPEQRSEPDTTGGSAQTPTRAAGDSSGGAATAPPKEPSADAGAARDRQPAAPETREHPAAKDTGEAPPAKSADDDTGEDKEQTKKDAAGNAAGMALSLVLLGAPATPAKAEDAAGAAAAGKRVEGQAKAVTPPAAAGNGAAAGEAPSGKPTAAAEVAAAATMAKDREPAPRASSTDGEKATSEAARPGGANGKSAQAGGAMIDPDSLRHAGGQDAGRSALAGLRARLSQAHAAADDAPHGQAADVRSVAQADERQGLSSRAVQASTAKEAEPPSRNDHAGAKAETVSAPAGPATAAPVQQGGNVAALADAIVARPDWTQALAKGADAASTAARPAHVSALKLQLNPADLGVVTATLRVTGNQLVISLQVHTAEAYRQLSTGNEAILDKLKGHGYAVENITVQHVAATGSAASQPAQAQQQPGFASQQGGHHAAAGGGQQSSGHGQGQGSGGRPGSFDQASPRPDEPVGVGGGRGHASDGLYV